MKTYNYINIQQNLRTICLVLTLILFISTVKTVAQDETADETDTIEKISPSLRLICTKQDDNTRSITAVFSYKDPETKTFRNVKDVPIRFYVGSDSIIDLGTIKTNIDGKAICLVKPELKLPKNEEGYIHFSIEYEGNDIFEASGDGLDVIDVTISMSLEVIDSVKTVTVKAEKILGNDEIVPLTDESIPIFVQRMFSTLKVGEVYLEEGEGTFEFPSDIPGDTLGLITVLAKFDDHDDYANVRKSQQIDWGLVTSHHTIYHPRSLWTNVAPIWMIVTLTIMLLGVWGHYLYVIYEIIKIKRGNKKSVPEESQ